MFSMPPADFDTGRQSESRAVTLQAALSERYHAMRVIRERVDKMCAWTLGALILIAGWLVEKGLRLDLGERIVLTGVVLCGVVAVRFGYLRDLEKGFRTQQQIAATIETELGLFPPYPERWRWAGTEHGAGKYFSSTYRLMYLGALILIACVFYQWILFCLVALLAQLRR
jgi:hypothetical protein